MLTVTEAVKAVLEQSSPLPARRLPLADCLGLRLAEIVRADRDSPPFSKALLDGYAARSVDLMDTAPVEFLVIEEVTAGRVPARSIGPGQATAIMTGAPMPEGADCVVMVEDSERRGDRVVLRPRKAVRSGDAVLPRGREMKAGEILLRAGDRLNPPRIGLLATVGQSQPVVHPSGRVAVLSTGDEIVPEGRDPGPGQIRNSNAPMLSALTRQSGAKPTELGIAPDEEAGLTELLARGLESDVLLITGGVSAGKLDLVPGALQRLGVRPIFHKVRLKPGKPLFFGVGPMRADGHPPTLVFGLPGNPVSGLVGFLLFVRPALEVLAGGPARPGPLRTGVLTSPFRHRGDRPTYHPALWREAGPGADGPAAIQPLDWAGSPDLSTVAMADGFAVFPAGDADYPAGAFLDFVSLAASDETML